MTTNMHRRFALVASSVTALLVAAAPFAAHAQRKSPLEDAPAIRKRVELRETRFEIGPSFSSTITQDYYHTFLGGGRLAFHLNDWLSIGAFGGFAMANTTTGFQERVVDALPMNPDPGQQTPTKAAATASMQKIKAIAGAQLEFAPFTGKYSLAGKLYAHYDFYVFGGGGVMNVEPTDASGCMAPKSYCGVTGWKPGAQAGVGLHTFFNQWLALNLEVRDFVAQLNPSGRDVNGDGVANADDSSWTSTFLVSANIMFFLPSTAAISQ